MTKTLQTRLAEKITRDPKSVVFIVGAGVTIGALAGANLPTSWWGLINHGLTFAQERSLLTPTEYNRCQQQLESKDSSGWIAVAETLTARLGGSEGGPYRSWLREGVGQFADAIVDRSVLGPLAKLARSGVLLTTTNYDSILEKSTGLDAVPWTNVNHVGRAIRDTPGVLHFHGHWETSKSVVLGSASYEELVGDAFLQQVMRTILLTKTFVFVGCGDGMRDPNWGPFFKWFQEVLAKDEHEHYRLCREGEQAEVAEVHAGQMIYPLVFGKEHYELGPFLEGLVPELPTAEETTCLGLLLNIGFPASEKWKLAARPELERQVDVPIADENFFETSHVFEHTSHFVWDQIRCALEDVVHRIIARTKELPKVELHIAGKAWPSVWSYLGCILRHSGVTCFVHHYHGDRWVRTGPSHSIDTTREPGPFTPHQEIRRIGEPGLVSIGVNCTTRDYNDFYYRDIRERLLEPDGEEQVATYTINRQGKMQPEELNAFLAGLGEALKHTQATGFTLGFAGPTWAAFWVGHTFHPNHNIDFLHFRLEQKKYEYALSTAKKPWIRGEVRVLLIGAEPEDLASASVTQELKAIREALEGREKNARASIRGNRVKFEELRCATRTEVRDKLKCIKPHIVHVSCHGEPNGLAFVGENDQINIVRGAVIAEYLEYEGHRPQIVFLSSCHSSSLAEVVAKKTRVVLTYPGVADAKLSRIFAKGFYTCLSRGEHAADAVEEATRNVDEAGLDPCNVSARCEMHAEDRSRPIVMFSPCR